MFISTIYIKPDLYNCDMTKFKWVWLAMIYEVCLANNLVF